jgi:CRP/FNR family nitrogen fixation transcriptional regulator
MSVFPGRTATFSKKFHRNSEIFCEEEHADHFFRVVSGSVRIVKFMPSGRRQIVAFWLPGDIFGLDASGSHLCSAEAIEDSEILLVNRTFPAGEASAMDGVVNLWRETISQLQRANNHLLLLGQKNAEERVGTFLLEMDERLSTGPNIELPMGRQDIADYLGLTVETVSRTLTELERRDLISMPSARRIAVSDRQALLNLSEGLSEYPRHLRVS